MATRSSVSAEDLWSTLGETCGFGENPIIASPAKYKGNEVKRKNIEESARMKLITMMERFMFLDNI